MELSFEQICSVAYGVSRVEKVADAIGLFRFTKEQEELYRDKPFPSFYQRTFATAGVTLEFDTDSENMSLTVEVSVGCGYRWFTHSIFVDDKRIGEITGFVPEDGTVAKAQGRFALGSGMKRVRIVFPWNEVSHILSLELDDRAKIIPLTKKRRVLIFGDSITQGYTAWFPENSYASRIARWLDADMVNKGIGGESYWPALAKTTDSFQPDCILVSYGANDWNVRTEEEFVVNSREFCSGLRTVYPNAKIIVLTPVWMKTREGKQKDRWPFENLVSRLLELEGKIDGMTVIDGTDLVPCDLACFAEDQVHPNDIGFDYYARNLKEKLVSLMD